MNDSEWECGVMVHVGSCHYFDEPCRTDEPYRCTFAPFRNTRDDLRPEASRGPDLAGLRKALERFVSLTDGWGPALDPASPWMEAYQQGRAALQAGATEPIPFEYGGALVDQRFSDVEPSPDLAFADALVAWFDVTHADTFGHDHHCPSKGDEDDDCTCGWTAVHRTDRARAALHTETSGEPT